MRKHTPTPWKAAKSPCIYKGRENEWEIHWSDDGECIAEVVHGEDDAAFIVRACNAHDELVALIAQVQPHAAEYAKAAAYKGDTNSSLAWQTWDRKAKAALSKARGEA